MPPKWSHICYTFRSYNVRWWIEIDGCLICAGARFFAQVEAQQIRCDLLENELSKELQNARLFRLIVKLNSINERQDMGGDWSETGDRYLLRLFRDYVFHSVTDDGRPWLDMAHIVQCLNKLDAGTGECVQLWSSDSNNLLVTSYADLKRAYERVWHELTAAAALPLQSGGAQAHKLVHQPVVHAPVHTSTTYYAPQPQVSIMPATQPAASFAAKPLNPLASALQEHLRATSKTAAE